MKQRFATRKIVDQLTTLAKEKSNKELSLYYDFLLHMLIKEYNSIPKGEDLFWFKQKERGLLEKNINEIRLQIEEYYRPEKEGYKEAEKNFYSVSNRL
jgi:hypothetical protein